MKLYRCWIMWRQPLVMAIPCILSLAFLGTSLHELTDFQTNCACIIVTAWTTQGFNIKFLMEYQPHPDWYFSTVTAFFFLSLGVNTLVTAMIIYKIITIYHDIREFNTGDASAHGNGQHDLYYPLLSVLIESGLITFVWQLTQSIMYKFADVAFPLVGGCVVMLFVRASCRLLVWCRILIYLSYREFRRQLSLCASKWAFPTIAIQQGQRIPSQRIWGAAYSIYHSHRGSTTGRLVLTRRNDFSWWCVQNWKKVIAYVAFDNKSHDLSPIDSGQYNACNTMIITFVSTTLLCIWLN